MSSPSEYYTIVPGSLHLFSKSLGLLFSHSALTARVWMMHFSLKNRHTDYSSKTSLYFFPQTHFKNSSKNITIKQIIHFVDNT